MSESAAAITRCIDRGTNWRARLSRQFFVGMAIAMLAIVALGFAPTLFLRPLFDVPEIPATLLLHGAVLTGTDFETQGARLAAGQIGDSLTLVAFAAMVLLAVVWRSRPELHKRLMLFASLQILGPAGVRTPATFAALGLGPIGAPFGVFLLISTVGPIAYDLLSRGRLHPLTMVCLPIQLGSVFLSFALAGDESIRAFVLTLH